MEADARMSRRVTRLTTLVAIAISGSASLAFGQEATPAGTPTEAPTAPPTDKAVPEQTVYRTGSGETRIVRTGETLMSIAREWSATTGTPLAQTMVGIYRSNPEAFGNGMSDMQRGAALRLPTAEQIREVPAGEAMSEVSRQLNIWRTQVVPPQPRTITPAPAPVHLAPPKVVATPIKPPVTAAPATPPRKSVATSTPVSGESRVRLVPPVSVAPAAEIAPTPEAQTLAALEERMARIEAQLAESRRLLEARSQELAQLEARAAKAESWQSTLASLWWLSPIFVVLTLVLAIALWWRSRRVDREEVATQPTEDQLVGDRLVDPVKEMTFDLPPIKSDESLPDALMRAPAVELPRVDPLEIDPLDLEGDPPPLNEASSMIDLARAYIEMGDYRSALLELQAAIKIGDESQRVEALRLLDSLPKS